MSDSNLFLKLDGIEGQSSVEGFAKEIEVYSFSQGISQQVTAGPSNAVRTEGRPHHQDFTIVKKLDEASPKLMEFCNAGEDVKTATFTFAQADGQTKKLAPLWIVTMTKALITNVSQSGSSGGGIPMETLSLNYATIKWEFKAQNEDAEKKGTAATGWDLAANKPLASK
jgi:type VI secretion system secreted protein Hcp